MCLNEHSQSAVDLPQLLAGWKTHLRVIARIPKGARIKAAEALSVLLNNVINSRTEHAWARLFGFAYGALKQPMKDAHDVAQKSLSTRIKNQIVHYMDTDALPEVERSDASANPRNSARMPPTHAENADRSLRRRVAGKFADNDVRGAVRLLASTEGFAGRGDDVVDALREKHPSSPDDLNLPAPPENSQMTPKVATKKEITSAVNSFPSGSAAGPDGIRPMHLKNLLGRDTGAAGEALKETLTSFINLILRGEVPEFARACFFGASLCALSKKDGGIRPIAVGNTWRRLVTKIGLRPLSNDLGLYLRPTQLGFGTRGGCEAAVHAARTYVNNCHGKRVLVKIDMKNAFNCIRRDVFLKAAREKIPCLYHLLWQAYHKDSYLFFGESLLLSSSGLQQGDPSGPALFSLGVDKASRLPNCDLNIWYLDDATLGGTAQEVLADLANVIAELQEAGLTVNDSKCEIILLNHTSVEEEETLSGFRDLLPNIRLLREQEFQLLGSPLTMAAADPILQKKQDELKNMAERLKIIDAHEALVLLKNCFAIPKLLYTLRTWPAFRNLQALEAFDTIIKEMITEIINVKFDRENWTQATLPVSLGGLGIRRATEIAAPAFISSHIAASQLMSLLLPQNLVPSSENDLTEAIEFWKEQSGADVEPVHPHRANQKAWDQIAAKLSLSYVERSGPDIKSSSLGRLSTRKWDLVTCNANPLYRHPLGQGHFKNFCRAKSWRTCVSST